MANKTTEEVLLRITLDTAASNKRLIEQTKLLQINKAEAKANEVAYKEGKITQDQYAAATAQSALRQQQLTKEISDLRKNLTLQKTANEAAAGSYNQVQAQLTLSARLFKELQNSAEASNEELAAAREYVEALQNKLKATDVTIGSFVRNVGNYSGAIEPLLQELARLQEMQRRVGEGTDEFKKLEQATIGFKSKIQQTAAQAGLSYEQAQNKIESYTAAIQPTIAKLVDLEQQQQQVGEGSEEFAKIGFKIGVAKQQLDKLPPALEETHGALGKASQAAQVLGVDTGKLESGFDRAKKGIELAKSSFGTLRTAMLAVPVFLLIAGIAALVSYFTRSREGAAALETGMAKLGAIMDVLIDRGAMVGKALTQLFTGNFSASANTFRQSLKGIGDEMSREIQLAGELSTARQKLERDEINNIDTNKKLLNQVERLKNVRDNEFKTLKQRNEANEKAYVIELEREKTLRDLAQRRVDLLGQEIKRRGGLEKATNEQLKAYKEAQNEVADIEEDAAGKQNELITNRYQLSQQALDKSIAARAADLSFEKEQLTIRLANVREASDEQLNILQRTLKNERDTSLNAKTLTEKERLRIQQIYEAKSVQLTREFAIKRAMVELQSGLDNLDAAIARETGTTDYLLELQRNRIAQEEAQQLAGLDKQAGAEAKERVIRANAAKAQADLEFSDSLRRLEEYLDDKHRAIEAENAKGLLTEDEYQKKLAAFEQVALAARKSVYEDYGHDVTAINKQAADAQIHEEDRVTKKTIEKTKERTAAAFAFAQDAARLVADSLSQTGQTVEDFFGKLLILVLDSLEKQLIATEAAAIAQATANSLATYQSALTGGTLGIAQGIALSALIAAAFETAKGVLSASLSGGDKQFALGGTLGGIVVGPSHAQGGINLWHRNGAYLGNMEGNEAILTSGVTRNPALLAAASMINVLGGGVPLAQRAVMSDGGIARAAGQMVLSIDYKQLALAVRDGYAAAPSPIMRVKDVADGLDKRGQKLSRAGF